MITDFLYVELNLNDISYTPYRKQNSNIMYINRNSSQPKNIIKQIPNIINDRLNKRSSTEENFLKVKRNYESIMGKCGYKEKLNYKSSEQNTQNTPKRKRKRNITLYNPPFCNSVKKNIGRKLISLLKKYFHNRIH